MADARPTVGELVLRDLGERLALGMRRYGVELEAHGGKDHLWEAYEEALDMAIYLRAEIERRNGGMRLCEACNGTGTISRPTVIVGGSATLSITCSVCQGTRWTPAVLT